MVSEVKSPESAPAGLQGALQPLAMCLALSKTLAGGQEETWLACTKPAPGGYAFKASALTMMRPLDMS